MSEHEHLHEHGFDHDHEHEHTHVDENGNVYTHTHGHHHDEGHDHEHEGHHEHPHGHGHTHKNTKAVLNRLSKAIGHLEKVRQMVEDGEDCSQVLIQLAAVRSAINNTGKIILKDHIDHCLVDAVECGDMEALKELDKAIEQFM